MRGGNPVLNDPAVEYGGFNPPILDARGDAAFLGEIKFLAGSPPSEFVVNTGSPGTVAPLYRRGDLAPGLGGPTFDASNLRLVHNAAGQSAFNAMLAGIGITTANDGVIYAEDGAGALRLVAREGNVAPDTAAGVTFGVLTTFDFAMNSAGQVAFHGSLAGPGVAAANDRGIWSEGAGTLHLVAREGMQAPVLPPAPNSFRFSRLDCRPTTSATSPSSARTNASGRG